MPARTLTSAFFSLALVFGFGGPASAQMAPEYGPPNGTLVVAGAVTSTTPGSSSASSSSGVEPSKGAS